ncbi:MAG: TCP-1/cpn60 chaperonin family protein [Thermoplasmatota archaeon]
MSRPSALHLTGADARREQEEVARWLLDSLGPAYGPHGGLALVRGADGTDALVPGGAAALREAAADHPAIQPYIEAAASLHALHGDGATGALLLAADLVVRGLDAAREGVPVASFLEGLELARRQAAARLGGLAEADRAQGVAALDQVAPDAPAGTAAVVLQRLPELVRDGRLDLELVDVVVASGGGETAAAWLPGTLLAPRGDRKADATKLPPGPTGLVLLGDGALRTGDVHARFRNPADRLTWERHEERRVADTAAAVAEHGIGVVACARGLPDQLADRLEAAGVVVATDVRRSTMERLARSTGAAPVPDWRSLEPSAVAQVHVEAWRDQWLVRGDGPAATLWLPVAHDGRAKLLEAEAEALLRAAGKFLAEARVVPGGGRWQRALAADLARVADHAPDKAPYGIQAAGAALGSLADRLVANGGGDPLAVPLLADASAVWDVAATAKATVAAGFDLARTVLRLDARLMRQGSTAVGLRGSAGKVGSPSGLPGDVPPHI